MTDSATGHASVERVTQALMSTVGSRHAAADILISVAEEGATGHWPQGISSEELGVALWRIAGFGPHDPDPLVAILRGWHKAEAAWLARRAAGS
ncbi:MAG TPA: hypothetical protein VMS08_04070 [Candidatus Saccharimonadia bacterium]|nr:hypothetical protein [Candidatus Saccharimonadia bacterium]